MKTTNLRKVGGSVMLTVPPAFLDTLGLCPGAQVGIAVDRGTLIIKPLRRPRYTLDQLLAQCDSRAARPRKDREWVTDQPVGRELI